MITRIGIVGVGNTIGIAQQHVEAYLRLSDQAVITAVHDIIPGRAQEYIDRYGLSAAIDCATYEELLDRVDAVSVCTPNATHVPLTVQALRAGKHVLCEKPFATDAAACDDAVDYAELSQRVAMIGLCYRNIPGLRYARSLIEGGAIGEVFYARQSMGGGRIANPEVKLEWRMQRRLSGPGAIADFGSHELDIIDMLFSRACGPITEVQCMASTAITERAAIGSGETRGVDNDDVGVFNVRLRSGALVSCTASRVGGAHTLEIFGSAGYLAFDGAHPFQLTVQRAGAERGVEEVPEELYVVDNNTPRVQFEINFYLQAHEFLAAIRGEVPVEATFARGQRVQRLIDALAESAETNTSVAIEPEEES
jgi:predicted dehydrogenase